MFGALRSELERLRLRPEAVESIVLRDRFAEPARELERVPEPHRTAYLKLVAPLEQVDLTEEAAILAEGYISRGIFHRKYIGDAVHVAVASFHKIDYLVTWNFGHLANVRRQARIRLFNTAAGFFVPQIVTPEFLVSEMTEKG